MVAVIASGFGCLVHFAWAVVLLAGLVLGARWAFRRWRDRTA